MPKIKSKALGSPRVRQYGTKSRYTSEELNKILEDIKGGKISQREASKTYNIPRNTLRNKLTGKHKKNVGRPTVFSIEEESCFVQHIITLSDLGLPISLNDVRYIAKSYLDSENRKVAQFAGNMPGWEWGQCFLKRHQNYLRQRFEINISRKRAQVNVGILNEFFDNLEKEIVGVPASNIYNYDETGFHDIPQKRKLLFKRSSRHPERIRNATKSCFTTLFCGNAEGNFIPPYVIMKGTHKWSDWVYGAPKGTRLNTSKSGWVEIDIFDDWFENHFVPMAKKQPGKKLLIGDNMSAHMSLKALKIGKENNINFIFFPSNSTHLLQPLDVGYFSSLKAQWRQVLASWRETKNGKKVVALPKAIFCQLLKSTLELNQKTATENLKKGFKCTGIYPVNRHVAVQKLPAYASTSNITNESIGDKFKEYLETIRQNDLAATHRAKKFCLPVAPGKSVSVSEVEEFYESRAALESQKKTGRGRGRRKAGNGLSVRATTNTGSTLEESNNDAMLDYENRSSLEESNVDAMLDYGDLIGVYSDSKNIDNTNAKTIVSKEVTVECLDLSSGSVEYKIEDCVIVQYDREFYPGVIIDAKDNMYLIRCMEKTGVHWKWPQNNDDLWYKKSDILQHLSPSDIIPISNRGVFSVKNSLFGAKLLCKHN